MTVPLPTPTQAEALRHALAATGRFVYVRGGFWTTEGCPTKDLPDRGKVSQIPAWSVTRQTIVAMERAGWLRKDGEHRDSPRVVTVEGREAVATLRP